MSLFKLILKYPYSPPDKKLGISGVSSPEHQRSSCKSSSSFTCYIRARGISVYLEHISWSIHVFRSLPTGMVLVRIPHLHKSNTHITPSGLSVLFPQRSEKLQNRELTNLNINGVWLGSGFEKVIGGPTNRFSCIL